MRLPPDAFTCPSPTRKELETTNAELMKAIREGFHGNIRVKQLEAANAVLVAVLHDVREYLDQRADIADYSDETGHTPNEQMKLLAEVDEAIAKAKESAS